MNMKLSRREMDKVIQANNIFRDIEAAFSEPLSEEDMKKTLPPNILEYIRLRGLGEMTDEEALIATGQTFRLSALREHESRINDLYKSLARRLN